MESDSLSIIACPSAWRRQALALVLGDLPEEQQRAIELAEPDAKGLFVAVDQNALQAACWAQRQPGNTAILWPPVLNRCNAETATQLVAAAVEHLDHCGIGLTQALASSRADPAIGLLEGCGFFQLAELVYLCWERSAHPEPRPLDQHLSFESVAPADEQRLIDLVERTYTDTLDCPRLNGVRPMHDVLAGYRETGDFRPDLWFVVRNEQHDVGVLLLAPHDSIGHLELLYMGLVPAARGNRWGSDIVQFAQQVTARDGFERLVLAVDAANAPAVRIYRAAGFRAWDQRYVFIRPTAVSPHKLERVDVAGTSDS